MSILLGRKRKKKNHKHAYARNTIIRYSVEMIKNYVRDVLYTYTHNNIENIEIRIKRR